MIAPLPQENQYGKNLLLNRKAMRSQYTEKSCSLPLFKRIGKVKKIESYSVHIAAGQQNSSTLTNFRKGQMFPKIQRASVGVGKKKENQKKIKRLGKNNPCNSFIFYLEDEEISESSEVLNNLEQLHQVQEHIETISQTKIESLSSESIQIAEQIQASKNQDRNMKDELTKQINMQMLIFTEGQYEQADGQIYKIVIIKAKECNENFKKIKEKEQKRYSHDVRLMNQCSTQNTNTGRHSNISSVSGSSKSSKKSNFLMMNEVSLKKVYNSGVKVTKQRKESSISKKSFISQNKLKTKKPHIVYKSHPYLNKKTQANPNAQAKPRLSNTNSQSISISGSQICANQFKKGQRPSNVSLCQTKCVR